MHVAYCQGVARAPWQGPQCCIPCNQEAHVTNRAKTSIGRCAVTPSLHFKRFIYVGDKKSPPLSMRLNVMALD